MESNVALGGKLKAFVQRCANVFGYRIEELKDVRDLTALLTV